MSLQQSALVKYCILVYPDHVYGIEYRTVLCQLRTCTLRCCPEPHESVGLCLVSGGLPPPSGGGNFLFFLSGHVTKPGPLLWTPDGFFGEGA